ncbi:beta-1,3-galactosyltransferase 5-like [Ciona intestinalis]
MNKFVFSLSRRKLKVVCFLLVFLWIPFLYKQRSAVLVKSKKLKVILSNNKAETIEQQLKLIPQEYLEENTVASQYEYKYSIEPSFDASCGIAAKLEQKSDPSEDEALPLLNPVKANRRRLVRFLMVFLVHSGAPHFEHRQVIRETWGSSGKRLLQLVFLLGKSDNTTVQSQVREENSVHGDILQADFHETYRNITLKAIMGLKWIVKYCPRAAYVTKVDDDMFVAAKRILSGAVSGGIARRRLLFCKPNEHYSVMRDGKYQVPTSVYNATRWPTFCFGGCWVASMDVVKKLYHEAMVTKQIYLDDVFITGILRLKIGLKLQRVTFSSYLFCHGRGDPEKVREIWSQKGQASTLNEKLLKCYS